MALWRSTFIVSAMTMLSRVLGLVRDMVLLNVFGAGKEFDVFVVAFRIPNFFRRLFAEGAFSQAFIPILTEYKTGRLHAEVQILISRVFGCLLVVMSSITLLAMIIAVAPKGAWWKSWSVPISPSLAAFCRKAVCGLWPLKTSATVRMF